MSLSKVEVMAKCNRAWMGEEIYRDLIKAVRPYVSQDGHLPPDKADRVIAAFFKRLTDETPDAYEYKHINRDMWYYPDLSNYRDDPDYGMLATTVKQEGMCQLSDLLYYDSDHDVVTWLSKYSIVYPELHRSMGLGGSTPDWQGLCVKLEGLSQLRGKDNEAVARLAGSLRREMRKLQNIA